jgi:hypothetical protein
MKTFVLPVRFARRLPDPVFPNCERHIMMCAVTDLPSDLPRDPNPRAQNIDRGIWREIKKHLLNEEGTANTFHLKNKGITIIAERVEKRSDDEYELVIGPGQGIVDGAHTYDLDIQSQAEIRELNKAKNGDEPPISQFVKLEILTGIPSDLAPEIAGGLNTAVQVQQMSLADLRGKFDWMKDELQNAPYRDEIAFRENENATYDARDIVVLLDLFNIFDFPNDKGEHPVRAYMSKAQVLANYLNNPGKYEKLRPILKDILELHDLISMEAADKHNETGGKAGKLAFMESRSRSPYTFPFAGGRQGKYRLVGGALFPMLAAFRWMVQPNPKTGLAEWRGGSKAVKALWDKVGGEMMRATQDTSNEVGRKPHAIGRSRNHWVTLHKTVAHEDLIRRAATA